MNPAWWRLSQRQLEDVEPADEAIYRVDDAPLVDVDIVQLDSTGGRPRGSAGNEVGHLPWLERIGDVVSPDPGVEEGADDDLVRSPRRRHRQILVQVVGTEAAAAARERRVWRRWQRADRDRIALHPRIEHPYQLGPIEAVVLDAFVADDEQSAIEQRQHGVREAIERRRILPAADQSRMRLVGDVENHRAAVDIPDIG